MNRIRYGKIFIPLLILTDGSIGVWGEIVDEDFRRRREKRFDVDVGVEGAEIVVAEAPRDADGRQHPRPLSLAQNDGVLKIIVSGRLESPTLKKI